MEGGSGSGGGGTDLHKIDLVIDLEAPVPIQQLSTQSAASDLDTLHVIGGDGRDSLRKMSIEERFFSKTEERALLKGGAGREVRDR